MRKSICGAALAAALAAFCLTSARAVPLLNPADFQVIECSGQYKVINQATSSGLSFFAFDGSYQNSFAYIPVRLPVAWLISQRLALRPLTKLASQPTTGTARFISSNRGELGDRGGSFCFALTVSRMFAIGT